MKTMSHSYAGHEGALQVSILHIYRRFLLCVQTGFDKNHTVYIVNNKVADFTWGFSFVFLAAQ